MSQPDLDGIRRRLADCPISSPRIQFLETVFDYAVAYRRDVAALLELLTEIATGEAGSETEVRERLKALREP